MTPVKSDLGDELTRYVEKVNQMAEQQYMYSPETREVEAVPKQIPGRRPFDEVIDVQLPKRTSTYHPVTEAEIEVYAQFGWLSSLLFTFFGVLSGFALGCLAAVLQGNLLPAGRTTLGWLAGVVGAVSVIFLVFGIALMVLQRKNKQTWKTEPEATRGS